MRHAFMYNLQQINVATWKHYRNQLLCRLPRQTAKARMADGKGLNRLPRTAKGSGNVGIGKELLCRLLFEADGKGAFAISG